MLLLQVFEAANSWIRLDSKTRAVHMPLLLRLVRLPLITPQYLADKVGKDAIIKGCLECRFVSCLKS